jgi:hypothetical protein
MNPVARVRHVLARRPWLYWCCVAVLALAAALLAADASAGVDEARRSWGTTRDVVVTAADIAPGEALVGRVQLRALPAPMVPDAAMGEVPPDAVARHDLAAGEIVVAPDLAAGPGPRALIPDGWQAVAVAETVPSTATVGDRVAAASEGVVLADDGLVVGRTADAVVVAVPSDEAANVAHAAVAGTLTLLLMP